MELYMSITDLRGSSDKRDARDKRWMDMRSIVNAHTFAQIAVDELTMIPAIP